MMIALLVILLWWLSGIIGGCIISYYDTKIMNADVGKANVYFSIPSLGEQIVLYGITGMFVFLFSLYVIYKENFK